MKKKLKNKIIQNFIDLLGKSMLKVSVVIIFFRTLNSRKMLLKERFIKAYL